MPSWLVKDLKRDGVAAFSPERMRARDTWRALPWRLFTFCCRCGDFRYCAGHRRKSMRCFDCFEEGRR